MDQAIHLLHAFVKRQAVSESSDDNVGSAAREANKSQSASQVVSTLVPLILVALVWLTAFILLRPKFSWHYAPRTGSKLLKSNQHSAALPSSPIGWFKAFWAIPDHVVLQNQSLDAFFFLRFLKMAVIMCLIGCVITWPILLPVYGTGGGGKQQLDKFTVANIGPNKLIGYSNNFKYFATVLVAWVYFGIILLFITRESIYYINLRQAYLMNPAYSSKLPSRTVLYCAVPEEYLNEAKLKAILGPAAVRFWFPAVTKVLDELVENRDKAAFKLEAAETKLIRTANAARLKAGGEINGATTDVEAAGADNSAARWIKSKDRPTHKTGKIPFTGPKVDSIDWCRSEIERLGPLIDEQQNIIRSGEGKFLPAVFVEFKTLNDAQAAFQSLTHHQAMKMDPRFTGMHPLEIIWSNLRIKGWERFLRKTAVITIVTLLVIFWSIPVALIGLISSLEKWTGPTSPTPWLRWLNKLPPTIFGLVSGLLPTVMLALLMALLPPFLRWMAKLSGAPTKADVEYKVSNYYFAFQVVQVFLVTTLASGAGSAAVLIIQNPGSIFSLLAGSVPTASNFYLSYFIIQGLGVVSGLLTSIAGLFVTPLLAKFLGSTPRKLFMQWNKLKILNYGTVFPIYTNLLVIALTYSLIAPWVPAFAAVGLSLFYFAYRYNILFVYDTGPDTKGLLYPRALQQIFVGLYIGEACIVGLIATAIGGDFKGAIGPLILMILLIVATALYNISLNSALAPLLQFLPKDLDAEERRLRVIHKTESNGEDVSTKDKDPIAELDRPITAVDAPTTTKKPNFITKFIKPQLYADYAHQRQLMPTEMLEEQEMDDVIVKDAYLPPSVWAEVPRLVIPRDPAGISGPEVLESGKVVPITDAGATLDEKNKIILDDDKMSELFFETKTQRMRYDM